MVAATLCLFECLSKITRTLANTQEWLSAGSMFVSERVLTLFHAHTRKVRQYRYAQRVRS